MFVQVVDQFSGEHQGQLDSVRHVGGIVKSVSGVVASCLQYEALRTATQEARASDQQFLVILSQAKASCQAQLVSIILPCVSICTVL